MNIADQASAEFEQLDEIYSVGTRKLYSRRHLLPDRDDKRAFDDGDFVGRLRALFGPKATDDHLYVLRHRATGLILTAYSAQSGPSYGGAPRYPAALPPRDEAEVRKQAFAQWVPGARVPPGFAPIVTRLNDLLDTVTPCDWRETRYFDDEPTVYVVGCERGKAFDQMLSPPAGLAWLLERAEQESREPSGMELELDRTALRYCLAHRSELEDLHRERVQAAWQRLVDAANAQPGRYRERWLAIARRYSAALELD